MESQVCLNRRNLLIKVSFNKIIAEQKCAVEPKDRNRKTEHLEASYKVD